MRRSVQQQESRNLSSGLSAGAGGNNTTRRTNKRSRRGRCYYWFLSIILLVVVLLLMMYGVSMYNSSTVHYDDQRQQQLLLQAQKEEENNRNEQNQQREQQLVRKRQADAARLAARSKNEEEEILVLTTSLGPIRIQMRPDLSEGSVDYVRRLVESQQECPSCNFYRAEKPGILQGIMANPAVPINTVLGACPPGLESVENECPEEWDPDCGCHGPVMRRGGVAWAAGDPGGPDFFIDAYTPPADWWGTQHTNFGFIEDAASMEIVDQILSLPVEKEGGMHYLVEELNFTMTLE